MTRSGRERGDDAAADAAEDERGAETGCRSGHGVFTDRSSLARRDRRASEPGDPVMAVPHRARGRQNRPVVPVHRPRPATAGAAPPSPGPGRTTESPGRSGSRLLAPGRGGTVSGTLARPHPACRGARADDDGFLRFDDRYGDVPCRRRGTCRKRAGGYGEGTGRGTTADRPDRLRSGTTSRRSICCRNRSGAGTGASGLHGGAGEGADTGCRSATGLPSRGRTRPVGRIAQAAPTAIVPPDDGEKRRRPESPAPAQRS